MDDQKKAAFYVRMIAIALVLVAGIYFGIKAIQTRVLTNELQANYSVSIPASWEGSYEAEKQAAVTTVWYTKNANNRAPLFQIKAYSKTEWESVKQAGGVLAQELATRGNAVFVYTIPPTNPYTGDLAADYQKMKQEVPSFINTFKLTE